MDFQTHSRKFWLIALGLLFSLFIVGSATVVTVAAQTGTATVNTGALNVRSGPGTEYSVIAQVTQGQVITLKARNGDGSWVFITTPSAVDGWVNSTYILPSIPISSLPVVGIATSTAIATNTPTNLTATPVPGTGTVNTGQLNVRSGPSPSYSILASVFQGETVALLGRNADSSWLYLQTNQGVVGWSNSKYITSSTPITNLPVVDGSSSATATSGAPVATAPPAGPTAVPGTASVSASTLNVRAAAGLSYARVDQIYYGNTVWVNGRNLDTTWISIITPNGATGWVNGKYIASNINYSTLPIISQTGTGIVLTGRLNVRSGAGPTFSVLTSAPQGANLTLLGRSSDNSWLYLRAPDAQEGWSRADYLGTTTDLNALPILAGPVPTSPASSVPPVTDPGNTAVLRSCPNLGCAVTGSVFSGLTITATGRNADSTWVYLTTSNNQQGWIPAQFVQLTIPVNSLPVIN